MPRTNVFVSYSHADRSWAERVRLHLAVMERRGFVDVWSDRRIRIGSDWKSEIDRALTEAKIAVLVVSPNFLASEFIWEKEMDLIVQHLANGMSVFPLITRPCAWQLEPILASLQARPDNDRALSEGSESDIDYELSRFVYELAKELDTGTSEQSGLDIAAAPRPLVRSANDAASEAWEGAYDAARPLRLVIVKRSVDGFEGRLEYTTEGTITSVTGEIHEGWSPSEQPWSQVAEHGNLRTAASAVTFRELAYERRGKKPIEFDGSYHVLQFGDRLDGAWFSNGRKVGRIELVRRRT
jgi:hypothetical protein